MGPIFSIFFDKCNSRWTSSSSSSSSLSSFSAFLVAQHSSGCSRPNLTCPPHLPPSVTLLLFHCSNCEECLKRGTGLEMLDSLPEEAGNQCKTAPFCYFWWQPLMSLTLIGVMPDIKCSLDQLPSLLWRRPVHSSENVGKISSPFLAGTDELLLYMLWIH